MGANGGGVGRRSIVPYGAVGTCAIKDRPGGRSFSYGLLMRNAASGLMPSSCRGLCSYFPELKVIARGFDIILDGKESDIEQFTVKLNMLIERRKHKMNTGR